MEGGAICTWEQLAADVAPTCCVWQVHPVTVGRWSPKTDRQKPPPLPAAATPPAAPPAAPPAGVVGAAAGTG